jgi:hypothetical protein
VPTYVHEMVHSGAETLSDQLAGTAVGRAGRQGRVRAAFVATDGTNTATLKGRESGIEVMPRGTHGMVRGATTAIGPDASDFIYEGIVTPGEELELEVISATASTSVVAVRT